MSSDSTKTLLTSPRQNIQLSRPFLDEDGQNEPPDSKGLEWKEKVPGWTSHWRESFSLRKRYIMAIFISVFSFSSISVFGVSCLTLVKIASAKNLELLELNNVFCVNIYTRSFLVYENILFILVDGASGLTLQFFTIDNSIIIIILFSICTLFFINQGLTYHNCELLMIGNIFGSAGYIFSRMLSFFVIYHLSSKKNFMALSAVVLTFEILPNAMTFTVFQIYREMMKESKDQELTMFQNLITGCSVVSFGFFLVILPLYVWGRRKLSDESVNMYLLDLNHCISQYSKICLNWTFFCFILGFNLNKVTLLCFLTLLETEPTSNTSYDLPWVTWTAGLMVMLWVFLYKLGMRKISILMGFWLLLILVQPLLMLNLEHGLSFIHVGCIFFELVSNIYAFTILLKTSPSHVFAGVISTLLMSKYMVQVLIGETFELGEFFFEINRTKSRKVWSYFWAQIFIFLLTLSLYILGLFKKNKRKDLKERKIKNIWEERLFEVMAKDL